MNKKWIIALRSSALSSFQRRRALTKDMPTSHGDCLQRQGKSRHGEDHRRQDGDGHADAKTAITRGKTKLDAAAVKVGERVVAEGIEEKQMIMAKTVKLGEVAVTAKN